MRRILKYLPQDSTKLYFTLSFIFGLIIFLVIFVSSNNFNISVLFGLFIAIFTLTWSLIDERLGKQRHQSIINSEGFQSLIADGFKIENINDYWGVTGYYKGYIFDIYFDWSTIVKPKVYRALVFNVYFVPPTKSNGQTDHDHLRKLSVKYDVSKWSFKPWNFWWREGNIIMKVGIGVFNPKYEKIKKWMDVVVKILQDESLLPVDRQMLIQWRTQFPDSNVPEITTYFKKEN